MRLLKEIWELYGRNLITMDEVFHFYTLLHQHDAQLFHYHKVVPEMTLVNLLYNRKLRDGANYEEKYNFLYDALLEITRAAGYADNKLRPYKLYSKSMAYCCNEAELRKDKEWEVIRSGNIQT